MVEILDATYFGHKWRWLILEDDLVFVDLYLPIHGIIGFGQSPEWLGFPPQLSQHGILTGDDATYPRNV